MSKITHDYIVDFLHEIQPVDQSIGGLIYRLEEEAKETGVPIIPIEVKSFISTILAIHKPRRILEIGAAIGYSSIVMSQYLQEGGEIVTIERQEPMLKRLYSNLKEANLTNVVKVMEGTAEDVFPNLTGEFDFVFIDAAKGQYNYFLEESLKVLRVGGIIIADNVLHKGAVAKSRYDIPRRQRTIHKRLRNFLYTVVDDVQLKSSILPIGDGVVICYKEGAKENE